MKLQYQEITKEWKDCGDRTEEFITRCVEFNQPLSRADVIAELAAGKTLSNDADDWYANCRDEEAALARYAAIEAKYAACKRAIPKRRVVRGVA